jgi:hypothetical protein
VAPFLTTRFCGVVTKIPELIWTVVPLVITLWALVGENHRKRTKKLAETINTGNLLFSFGI